ncbi:hypothetical protein ACFSDD_15620 [Salipiger marinus]|jgi:hypothetical protein|uniref:hypothetical protein n=1 Tax=Salipiger marinus TaxID=555512 RepID=UPI000E9480FD|nr:hypothetical protein [Salipiger manganoxidans]MCD1617823.1 hypothetical protein [Salipiger manganoxidans]MEB3418356.1 hypothetical protein [Salipiger manganoxidans]HBM59096.1 hypothetical protein [Citreicella sp.]HBT00850.1 hypothetical protein [Citreicella sp.]
MTALKEFQRLEATALWRPEPQAQRREVIVSLGDATITISEFSGRPLAHWSIAAIIRANRGRLPAIYHPDGDPGETLELPEDETTMVDAIERLLRAIERRRPQPGTLRQRVIAGVAGVLALGALVWLPSALLDHAERVVPRVKRAEIGEDLLGRITRVAGQPCTAPEGRLPLRHLAQRVLGEARSDALVVLPEGVRDTAHLPGGMILVNAALLEDYEDPDVAAGYILAEALRARHSDPLGDLLRHAGLWSSLKLLTTGRLPDGALQSYAETLLTTPADPVPTEALLDAFAAAELRSSPYAYARDATGESTVALIEADPRAREGSRQVLSDADWLRLQAICDG